MKNYMSVQSQYDKQGISGLPETPALSTNNYAFVVPGTAGKPIPGQQELRE
jgi:hypothetical protein